MGFFTGPRPASRHSASPSFVLVMMSPRVNLLLSEQDIHGQKAIFAADPDGNLFELVQR